MTRCLAVLLMVSASAIPIFCKNAPLPERIVTAKTVYIENHGSAKLADLAYEELQKWGRFQMVDSAEKADIVLVLSEIQGQSTTGRTATYDPSANGGYGGWTHGHVHAHSSEYSHLEIHDGKSGETLYADTQVKIGKTIQELRKRIEEQEKTAGK